MHEMAARSMAGELIDDGMFVVVCVCIYIYIWMCFVVCVGI